MTCRDTCANTSAQTYQGRNTYLRNQRIQKKDRAVPGSEHRAAEPNSYLIRTRGNYKGAVLDIKRPAPSIKLNYGGLARAYR